MQLKVRLLNPEAKLPRQAHGTDAGMDLYSTQLLVIEPGERVSVATGIAVEIPAGHGGLVVPRSGLAAKYGIGVVNGPGLIDSGYRGEIRCLLINHDPSKSFKIAPGDRIAQLVIVAVPRLEIVEVDELEDSVRGEGGFGSTGR